MPVQDGEFYRLTEEQIKSNLEDNLKRLLDKSADPGNLVTKQLDAEATTLAENQEEALERVYYAGYLEDAEGKELDKLVDLISLTRREASPATGTATFSRQTPPTSTYTIPRGTKMQTEGLPPMQFETTDSSALQFIEGWESNDLADWIGDVSDFSVVESDTLRENYAVQLPAIAGSAIRLESGGFSIGTTFNANIKPQSGSITEFRFARQDESHYHAAIVDTSAGEIQLETVKEGSVVTSSSKQVSIPTGSETHVEFRWSLHNQNRITLYDSPEKGEELATLFLDNPTQWAGGNIELASGDGQATSLVGDLTTTQTTVNIEALDGGINTNVGPDQIQVMSDGVAGVESVTNQVSTGNTKYLNAGLNPFSPGQEREGDEELRERAFNNTSIGGAATGTAIKSNVRDLPGVESVDIFKNKSPDVKDGLPSHSYEVLVYGGSNKDVANAIYETASLDSQDVGGIHGTENTYTLSPDLASNAVTIHFSRPAKLDVDIELDLIVDDNYVGDNEIKSIIVSYIGGTDIDGSFMPGGDAGEDIYEAVLKQQITDPTELGVWEVDSVLIDKNGDGTDDTTELASGADVLEVADSEITQTNARDNSITVNTSPK
jgi:uncharacterized phage protein gp47/JayE